MATYYGKFGSSGDGLAVGTPGNLYEMLTGTGAWSGAISGGDTIVACPGTYTSSDNVIMASGVGTAGASSWLTVRLAAPGEFPGENGTELKFILGSSYNHRFLSRAYTRWIAPSGSKVVIEKVSGDGLGYWQAYGPMRFEGVLRCQAQTVTNQGQRYVSLAVGDNGGLCWYDAIEVRHGRNNSNGPAVVIRDSANRVRVGTLTVELSTDVTTEGYPTGLLRSGSGSSFDPGNILEIDRVVVEGLAAETDHLIEVGSQIYVGSANTGLMKAHHDTTRATINDFGEYTVGVDGQFRQHAGSPQGRVDGALSSPPTLQGTDPSGVAQTFGLFPSTQGSQLHAYRPLRLVVDELALHEAAAAREVSVEMLLNDTLDAAVDTRSVWAEVTYLPDGASAPVTESTRAAEGAGATLAASEASWSATTYATQDLTARAVGLTTSQAVTAGSKISVALYWTVPGVSSADFALVSGRTLVELAA